MLQRAADDKDLVVRNAVSRALRESARVTTPAEQARERGVRRPAPPGRARAAARAVHRAPEPQALPGRERHGAEGARRSRQRRRGRWWRSRPTSRSAWPATSSSSTPPGSGSSSTTTPRSATSSRCCGRSRSAALRVHAAANRREWQIFLSLLLSLSERGEPDQRFEELFERLGVAPRSRASRSSAPCSRSTIPRPSRPRSRPSGSTRRAWPSPRT